MFAEPLGKGASLLFSGSLFNNSGESPLYFPQLNTPANNGGQALRMDSEKGYHFFANLALAQLEHHRRSLRPQQDPAHFLGPNYFQ